MKNEELNQKEQLEEILKCKEDIAYFLETYCEINDPQTFETFPFKLWDFQKELLRDFQKHDRIIVLKGRQLGVSWCASSYALHKALFYNNANVLMLSKREDEAQKLLLKVKFQYSRLPQWIRKWRPLINDNKKEFEIEQRNKKGNVTHHSVVFALPATEDAGRSETASVVIADEWAFHPHAEKNWAALSPTIDAGGQFIGVSTANGLGNFYYKMWKGAEANDNGFKGVFLPYHLRPGRDDDWYHEKKSSYTDEKLFQQEYPSSPLESFITTGGCIFDLDGLQYIAETHCRDPLTVGEVFNRNGYLHDLQRDWPELKIWSLPRVGQGFIVGADPAGGEPNGDFSVAQVIDAATGEQYASIAGRYDPDTFAGLLAALGRSFNRALLAVERNNHGYAVLSALKNVFNYENIFIYKKDRKTGDGDNKEGWPTNSKTKAIMESRLQTEIAQRSLKARDMDFVYEAQSYVRTGQRTGAEGSGHDDRVSSMGVALMAKDIVAITSRGRPRRKQVMKKHFGTRHR